MSRIVETLALASLWVAALFRLPGLRQGPRKRAVALMFLTVALALTFSAPAVAMGLDRATHVWNIATLLKDLLALAFSTMVAILVAVVTATGDTDVTSLQRRWTVLGSGASLALIGAFLVLHRPTEVDDFLTAYADRPAGGAYWAIVIGYLTFALVWLMILVGRHAGRPDIVRATRVGLWISFAGIVVALFYATQRAGYVIQRLAHHDWLGLAGHVEVSRTLMALALLLIALGFSVPAIAAMRRAVGYYVANLRLYGLWRTLTSPVPAVLLDPPRRRLVDAALSLRAPDFALHRRVIEIRDAMLRLACYAPAEVFVPDGGETGRRSDPRAEAEQVAAWLRQALTAQASGMEPAQRAHPSLTYGGSEVASEARWLRGLSAAMASAGTR